jgi:hypothetical protein
VRAPPRARAPAQLRACARVGVAAVTGYRRGHAASASAIDSPSRQAGGPMPDRGISFPPAGAGLCRTVVKLGGGERDGLMMRWIRMEL